MIRRFPWLLCAALLAASAAAQAPPAPPLPGEPSALERAFWGGVRALNILVQNIATLSGGAERGEVWISNLQTETRSRVGTAQDLAWPVLAPDGATVFALRAGRLLRIDGAGAEVPVGTEANWRKLLGVTPEGIVLGLVAGSSRARPAATGTGGVVSILPEPETEETWSRVAILLQENRAYEGGKELVVRRSTRGGRGFDVFLLADGRTQNISDCGDSACGQPSLSSDGTHVLYVRSSRR